ncbi:hypothetical protein AC249_AIPGENE8359 [Exaiptasia diaphana]|nr:hypothetical protein AC249_AIPGENE8359 [Exaiptasia diaphana]
MDDIDPDYVRNLVLNMKWSHAKISEELQRQFPNVRGLSEMSVRRFCSKHKIHRTTKISDGELDVAIFNAVSKVGPTYGRKMIKGKLEVENIRVHDKRISASLARVTPGYQQLRRQNTARQVNLLPYNAHYFGHKVHYDQNEKLVMYGCTSVMAVDGYSNTILGIATMPIKNNLEIYRCLYRPITIQYGLWDQLRVDCGKEFYLILYIQENLANFRYNTLRAPYIQTTSTMSPFN